MFSIKQTINCRGTILDFSKPKVMGILNITDDSFYDGGQITSKDQILSKVELILNEGADIIDLGAQSSRPGAKPVEETVELDRICQAIELIKLNFPQAIISIDTYRSQVAKAAFDNGAHILNDVSAFSIDPELLKVIDGLSIPYILMHMQGNPSNMQNNPVYNNVTNDLIQFFVKKINLISDFDIKDIILDPGFGFGKKIEHNYELLNKLQLFQMLEKPLMVGLSRKSMIYKVLDSDPANALNGTSALHMSALERGACILRVHDVKEAKEVINLYLKLSHDYESKKSKN